MAGHKRLPPEILDEWLIEAADELGLDPGEVDINVVLDLTRDIAHDVARPAAPLTAFLLGLALGRGGGPEARSGGPEAVEALAGRLVTRAAAFAAARADGEPKA
ncbi:Molybdopterin-guanine dinucleotide biosynthesis protein MobA [Actinomycetales bacterium JB111]|nr:Molybdopterin-guanine dinucleotide biosynthesis protein MobA [Actinomycetales bacterium JB111]